ncbi:MAG TPA: hypothetical protein VH417_15205, partial [Vicinamibacterales bacterium]
MSEPDAAEHALREPQAVEDDWHRPWLGAGLVAAVAAAFAIGVIDLPRETAALPAIARQAMEIALP